MPGGFVSDVLGYLVFLKPEISHGIILWHWTVQSGGGWNWLGGAEVKVHSEGRCPTVGTAEEDILEALQNLGVEFE
jgi:hypothetical protein